MIQKAKRYEWLFPAIIFAVAIFVGVVVASVPFVFDLHAHAQINEAIQNAKTSQNTSESIAILNVEKNVIEMRMRSAIPNGALAFFASLFTGFVIRVMVTGSIINRLDQHIRELPKLLLLTKDSDLDEQVEILMNSAANEHIKNSNLPAELQDVIRIARSQHFDKLCDNVKEIEKGKIVIDEEFTAHDLKVMQSASSRIRASANISKTSLDSWETKQGKDYVDASIVHAKNWNTQTEPDLVCRLFIVERQDLENLKNPTLLATNIPWQSTVGGRALLEAKRQRDEGLRIKMVISDDLAPKNRDLDLLIVDDLFASETKFVRGREVRELNFHWLQQDVADFRVRWEQIFDKAKEIEDIILELKLDNIVIFQEAPTPTTDTEFTRNAANVVMQDNVLAIELIEKDLFESNLKTWLRQCEYGQSDIIPKNTVPLEFRSSSLFSTDIGNALISFKTEKDGLRNEHWMILGSDFPITTIEQITEIANALPTKNFKNRSILYPVYTAGATPNVNSIELLHTIYAARVETIANQICSNNVGMRIEEIETDFDLSSYYDEYLRHYQEYYPEPEKSDVRTETLQTLKQYQQDGHLFFAYIDDDRVGFMAIVEQNYYGISGWAIRERLIYACAKKKFKTKNLSADFQILVAKSLSQKETLDPNVSLIYGHIAKNNIGSRKTAESAGRQAILNVYMFTGI